MCERESGYRSAPVLLLCEQAYSPNCKLSAKQVVEHAFVSRNILWAYSGDASAQLRVTLFGILCVNREIKKEKYDSLDRGPFREKGRFKVV